MLICKFSFFVSNSIFWSNSIYIELNKNIEFGLFGNIELDKNIEFGHTRYNISFILDIVCMFYSSVDPVELFKLFASFLMW